MLNILYLLKIIVMKFKKVYNDVCLAYPDASHHCFAYIIASQERANDDGEPSQTAGIVIYDVLKKNNITNVLAVVTRYFGGIKLGAGGLVRAYSSSTAIAVKAAQLIKMEKKEEITIKLNYNNFNIASKLINDSWIVDKTFTEAIIIKLLIPTDEVNPFITKIKDITKNQVEIL